MATKAFIVSHTHWDREWYQPFQEFRVRLVRLVDRLLDIMASDPDYRFFMLDGQTVILEDYLEIRPDREGLIRELVQQGRLLIGPWFVLPDEFLVSTESLVRNLLLGDRISRRFGGKMRVGYVPDQFGHVAQLPQILKGFDMEDAVLWRGLDDHPVELRWRGPDGSELLLIYMRGGYGNPGHMPTGSGAEFAQAVRRHADSLTPFVRSDCILLMNGADHMEPQPNLPAALNGARDLLKPLTVEHSTLPRYIRAVRESLGEAGIANLPQVDGELRSPKSQPLLPGVLSARMWIKQRNAYLQNLLERWAEPWMALAERSSRQGAVNQLDDASAKGMLWQAWRYLLENHPHDSICGCSVDQVHREMRTRFDWCEQIGETLTAQSLRALAGAIDTRGPQDDALAVVVFNPLVTVRTDIVEASVELPQRFSEFAVIDEQGHTVPHQILECEQRDAFSLTSDPRAAESMLGAVQDGKVRDKVVREVSLHREGSRAIIDVVVADTGAADAERLRGWLDQARALLSEEGIEQVDIRAKEALRCKVAFIAEDVPGIGYSTYWVTPGARTGVESRLQVTMSRIENEHLAIQIDPSDGTLSVLHKPTGTLLQGVNRFADQGDRGDEYNFCPPERDLVVTAPATPPVVRLLESGPVRTALEIESLHRVPESLTLDRTARSRRLVTLPITTRVALSGGVPRVDIQTRVMNVARDHRLRVLFPTPVAARHSWAEDHYYVDRRSLELPTDTKGWIEEPQPTFPQQSFCDVSDGEQGVMVGVRGLPEAEVMLSSDGATIAVTLLRCVGWLSRDDISTRRENAGPTIATPEAQEIGEHRFEYCVIPHAGGWQHGVAQAHAFRSPMRAVTATLHDGSLPKSASLLEVSPASLMVAAVKGAEDGKGIIVRVCNYGEESAEAALHCFWPIADAQSVTLDEVRVGDLPIHQGHEVTFTCGPWEVVSLRLLL